MRDVPFNEILGVGVSVTEGVMDGVAVKGFAVSVSFASARAVLARDVSTAGGFVMGACVFPHATNVSRRIDPIKPCHTRFCCIVASVIRTPPDYYTPGGRCHLHAGFFMIGDCFLKCIHSPCCCCASRFFLV